MQIDGNRLIEILRRQRNEALDAAAMLEASIPLPKPDEAKSEGEDGEA